MGPLMDDEEIVSHWHLLLEEVSFSPKKFYSMVASNIKEKEIPGVEIKEVYFKEGGIFSDKRLYLLVRRRQYSFYVCAAPFGRDFFVSYWLLAGGFYTSDDISFYQHDAVSMFLDSASSAVQKAVDEVKKVFAEDSLSKDERKPKMKDFYKGAI